MDVESTVVLAPLTLDTHESWLPSEHPLHRPRHGRRQLTALLSATVFFLVPLLTLVLGARPAEFENHRLAPFPSPSQGWGFFTGLPDWAVDRLPFRDVAIRTADDISRGIFDDPPPYAQNQPQAKAPPFAPGRPGESRRLDPSEPPVSAGFSQVIEGKDGWLYYGFDVQGKCRPVRPLDEVLTSLGRIKAAVEQSGRQFVLVVPPDKSTIVTDHLPDDYVGEDCATAASEAFWSRATSGIGTIDLREDLRKIDEVDGTPPYHQLDTHWDDRGAIMMLRRIAERLEPGVSAGWELEPERVGEYPADLPKLLGRSGNNAAQLYSLAPDGDRDRTRQPVNDLRLPTEFRSTPGQGMVTTSVGLVCDSFLLPATRYLPAVFAEGQAVFHSSIASEPQAVADVMTRSEVVVLEIVERNLVSGFAPVLDPANVDFIVSELAKHPR